MIWWQSTVTSVTEFPRTFAVLSDWTWVCLLSVSGDHAERRAWDAKTTGTEGRTLARRVSRPTSCYISQDWAGNWMVSRLQQETILSSKIHLKGTPLASLHSLPAPFPRLCNPAQQITTLQSLHDQSLSLFGLVQAQRELRWRAEHRELQLKAEMTEMRCCASAVTACCGMWRHVAMCLPVATYHIVV